MSLRGLLGLAGQISDGTQTHIVSTRRGRVITEFAVATSILGWTAIVAANYFPRRDADLWLTSWAELGDALGSAHLGLAGAAANLARAALIVLSGLGYGCLLMRSLRPAGVTGLEYGLFAVAMGLAALADLVLLVGSIGWLHIEVLWALLVFGIGALGFALVPWLRGSRPRARWPSVRWSLLLLPWLSLCAVQFALSVEGLVLPDLQTDAWHYHLGAPKFYLIAGRLIGLHGGDWPNIWLSDMPFTWEMLYTVALGIGDPATGKALHFAAGVLCSLVAFALGSRLHSPLAGVVAGTAFFLAPIVVWESTTADNDLALAFFEGVSVLAVFGWLRHRDRRWLILAGLLAGVAMGIKLTGGYLVLAGGVALGVWWWRCDRSLATLRELSWLSVLIATYAPWLIRSAVLTGNPVFPVGDPLLFPLLGPTSGTWRDFLTTHYGLGRSPADYLTLPWSVTLRGDAFEGTPGPLFLALVPALVLVVGRRTWATGLLVFFAAWFLFWALGSQQMRFLIPGLLFAAPLVGIALAATLGSTSAPIRVAGAGVALLAVCLCSLNLPSFSGLWQASSPPVVYATPWRSLRAIASGAPLRDQLELLFPTLKAVDFINTSLPPDARLYALEGGLPNLYVDRVVISLDEPIGEGLELRDSFERKNGAERLASFGIQYLYTDGTRKALVDHAPWVSRTRVIYRGDGAAAIYAIDIDP